ncbi:MAG TPA: hydrogenase maturation nickel metallochaperone HypA [Spirochaetota bacterium]|nr:hydrogenase maturation nickel metallochaperone HypA [Spirochaetota bacterium]HOF13520.1 hydrogenase maturation nickel metallochaperone HypA [Spirochaetota bacterium]HOM86824.1 hydrogenase maturation nickel metallochaperone HypA [Spirochaetota bacterium]HOR92382.1 hydrogenase maturation nickel metallochaperone HypA [Spirochaetota bacterium]HPD03766.1 hydrogenase maturation nickel metallochaperone HypA [Spirochaetota bacterium]
MHELSIMSNVLDIVVQHAQQNGAVKVTKIHLLIGELSDYIPEWMQNYFDFVSKDTIAENAQLVVEMVKASLQCGDCGTAFAFNKDDWQFSCPKCHSPNVTIVSGRELTVKTIEIEGA